MPSCPKGIASPTVVIRHDVMFVCFFVDLMFPHDGTAGGGGGEDLNFKFYDVY